MGTDIPEVVEKLPLPSDIKVHSLMCTDLTKLVERVVMIFPEIEASRPRCSSGIQSLCLLNGAIDKSKSLLHDCCESSKLYLALTGNSILSRCKRSKNLLEQSLSQIQNMVPVMLASKISRIIAELRAVTFSLDPSEEEAGKAVKALLELYKTGDRSPAMDSGNEYIRIAVLKLRITTQKALLLERRSIKKLLNKLVEKEGSQPKKQILFFLLDLLKKYGNSISSGQLETDRIVHDREFLPRKADFRVDREESRKDVFSAPPEEFKCPISLKLMYDPVVIDSGQTYERTWIQKWFDEGHDICPKTKRKLSRFSLTPNTSMKDLISKWCAANGIAVSDPRIQLQAESNSWENSSISINSLSISMNNLQLPVDYSNVSIGSLDNTRELNVELDLDDALPWEFQCKIVEDLMARLKHGDQDRKSISIENLVESVVRFLKVARDINDVKAQRIGCCLLLVLITKCRCIRYLNKDAYQLITGFLESEVIEEALAITEALSAHQNCLSEIADSGALPYIFKILDSGIREIQTLTLKILYNFTSTRNARSFIVSADLIPKLVTLFEDDSLSRYCMAILSNLCGKQDDKKVIAETEGCVSFIARVLESESCEEQEQALEILLLLCAQSVEYCRLVMNEGVIPAVVSISINGNDKGKAKAFEMLRNLREIEYDDYNVVEESPVPDMGISKDSNGFCVEKKGSPILKDSNGFCAEKKAGSRASRIFSKLSLISRGSLVQKRKI